jgi:hypothetical protein
MLERYAEGAWGQEMLTHEDTRTKIFENTTRPTAIQSQQKLFVKYFFNNPS